MAEAGWVNQSSDPKLDEILNRADSQLDPVRRLETIKEAQRYILDQAIIIPLITHWFVVAACSEVKGYHWDAVGYARLVDIWLDKKRVRQEAVGAPNRPASTLGSRLARKTRTHVAGSYPLGSRFAPAYTSGKASGIEVGVDRSVAE